MEYNLAKRLKDAGFPFQWIDPFGKEWTAGCTYHGRSGLVLDIALCICKKPSLEQLIEACGDNILLTNQETEEGKWMAWKKFSGKYFGSTPEEAVAKLWLELKGVSPTNTQNTTKDY